MTEAEVWRRATAMAEASTAAKKGVWQDMTSDEEQRFWQDLIQKCDAVVEALAGDEAPVGAEWTELARLAAAMKEWAEGWVSR